MPRFEVVPSALSIEARRLAVHGPALAQLTGTLQSAGADGAGASGDGPATGSLEALSAAAAGALAQLEVSVGGLAAATEAAARRYVNTDASQIR